MAKRLIYTDGGGDSPSRMIWSDTMDKEKRIRTYTCEACGDGTACECSTDGDIPPTRCCMQWIPKWTEGYRVME